MSDTKAAQRIGAILDRCTEEGDCLIWTGATNRNQLPIGWIDGRTRSLRRALYEHHTGKKLAATDAVLMTCKEPCCLHALHMRRSTRGDVVSLGIERGSHRSPARAQKLRTSYAERHNYDGPGIARKVRASTLNGTQTAAALGISPQTVSKIRTGNAWREAPGPFHGLGAR